MGLTSWEEDYFRNAPVINVRNYGSPREPEIHDVETETPLNTHWVNIFSIVGYFPLLDAGVSWMAQLRRAKYCLPVKGNSTERKGTAMALSSTLIESRLAWCRFQRVQAITKEDAAIYLAEEEGLLDAILGRNRAERYGQDQRARRTSYETGLLDGRALLGLQRWNDTRQSLANNNWTNGGHQDEMSPL